MALNLATPAHASDEKASHATRSQAGGFGYGAAGFGATRSVAQQFGWRWGGGGLEERGKHQSQDRRYFTKSHNATTEPCRDNDDCYSFSHLLSSVILGTTNNRWHCCANLKTSGGVVLGWVEEEDG